MRSLALAAALVCALAGDVLAWGQEGHSIIAEIAQQRLSQPAAQMVATLLKGRSLLPPEGTTGVGRPTAGNCHMAVPSARRSAISLAEFERRDRIADFGDSLLQRALWPASTSSERNNKIGLCT
jgi:hypothetical protein